MICTNSDHYVNTLSTIKKENKKKNKKDKKRFFPLRQLAIILI